MKHLFLITFLSVMMISLYAQETVPDSKPKNVPGFRGGVFAGLASTDVYGFDQFDQDFLHVGVLFGGMVSRSFSDKFSIQMEMMYIRKGSRIRDNEDLDSINNIARNIYTLRTTMALSYLEVPIMF